MSTSAALTSAHASHLAQFYSTEAELVDAIADHALDGWRGAAVLVVTPDHRRAIEDKLAEIDAAGRPRPTADALLILDAEATLHRFSDGERIDALLFDDVIGGVLRGCARRGQPIRVYGEMVAVLWDAGNVTGALELEQLWNDLGSTMSFSLLCGYPTHASLAGEDAIRRVCDAHSAVVGLPRTAGRAEACRLFERTTETPARVRHFVAATLNEWNVIDRLDDIVLVADELVTNAVVHAASDVAITLTSDPGSIRVAVGDRSAAVPRPANRGADAMSGRGLHIINVLSSAWGHESGDTGKIVWARFDV